MQLHEALASGNLSIVPPVVEVTTRGRHPRGGRDAHIHHDSPSIPSPCPVRATVHCGQKSAAPPSGKELDDHVPLCQRPPATAWRVVTVIMMIIGGLGFLLLAAIVVGVVDAFQASSWRQIAAERREDWEARHLQPHGRPSIDEDDD
jgi:hypothetical protein